MHRFARPLLLILLLAGCTVGRSFDRPTEQSLRLGETTKDEAIATFGPPFRQASRISTAAAAAVPSDVPAAFVPQTVAGTHDVLAYAFADRSRTVAYGGAPESRLLALEFLDGRLFYWNYTSSFAADRTDFDQRTIAGLAPGRSTRQEVLAALGQPTGRAIWPALGIRGDEKLIWSYSVQVPARNTIELKRLEVLIRPDGIMRDLLFVQGERALPPQPQTSTVPVFIPTPVRR